MIWGWLTLFRSCCLWCHNYDQQTDQHLINVKAGSIENIHDTQRTLIFLSFSLTLWSNNTVIFSARLSNVWNDRNRFWTTFVKHRPVQYKCTSMHTHDLQFNLARQRIGKRLIPLYFLIQCWPPILPLPKVGQAMQLSPDIWYNWEGGSWHSWQE